MNTHLHKCKVCGYIYDPSLGDNTQGIEPGKSFEELPHDWKCPICSVSKEYFEEMD